MTVSPANLYVTLIVTRSEWSRLAFAFPFFVSDAAARDSRFAAVGAVVASSRLGVEVEVKVEVEAYGSTVGSLNEAHKSSTADLSNLSCALDRKNQECARARRAPLETRN